MANDEAIEVGLELLRNLRHITALIEELQEQIDHTYSMLTGTAIKQKLVDVQTSAPVDQMAEKMADILELQEKLQKHQAELCQKKNTALSIIKRMEIEHQQLLIRRYMKGLTIEQVAEEASWSYYWTWQKLHEAEDIFCKLFASVYRS